MESKKIVIIDDEQEMTRLLELELSCEGYTVYGYHHSREGLEAVRQIRPDLVMLDVMMPEMDGYTVLKHLKNDPRTKNIPVIMLTAKGLEEEIQKGLDLHVDDYVSKPFHAGLLLKRIAGFLNDS